MIKWYEFIKLSKPLAVKILPIKIAIALKTTINDTFIALAQSEI